MPCESPASLFLYLKWATRRGPKTELELIVMRANKQKKKLENDKKTNKQTRKKDYLRHDEDCIPFRLWFSIVIYCAYAKFITYVHVCEFVEGYKKKMQNSIFLWNPPFLSINCSYEHMGCRHLIVFKWKSDFRISCLYLVALQYSSILTKR